MPGARLTHEDRRRIAAWLAEGLGYAEIARRLGRPTSTISREAARGGVPYVADRAQRAAAVRASRKPVAPPVSAEQPFVEEFAALLAATGFPRMAARVFACLLTDDSGSRTAAELVRRLSVSPASVSKTIAYLEGMDLVSREPDPGGRRERYVIADDVWLRAWQTDTGAHARVASAAWRGASLYGESSPAGSRLARMGEFFGWLSSQMDDGGVIGTAAANDALTVVAALVYAGRPLSVGELAVSLGWKEGRVGAAIDALERRPVLADPFVVEFDGELCAVMPRAERLSAAQRSALRARP